MALEHAILVSLSEQPAAGLELARRFDRSIGFFWSASHQQIYKVLGRMEGDGWVTSTTVGQQGRPEKKVYAVADLGRAALEEWLAEPTRRGAFRSEIAVKMRGASYGDRETLLANLRELIADHHLRRERFETLRKRDYPHPEDLTGQDLDMYLVLRGGIHQERFWIEWLTEYLDAHTTESESRR